MGVTGVVRQVIKPFLMVVIVGIAMTSVPRPALAGDSDCVSEITKTPGSIEYGDCVPHRLWINPAYGSEYARLMQIAINAGGTGNDYDTAIINFRRAQTISGVTDSEVRRGLLGATLAKQAKETQDGTHTPYQVWLRVTGEYSDYD